MKFFKVLCVVALALLVTGSVYAETQSVKVSGDLTVRSIFRDQYDYQGAPDEGVGAVRTGLDGSTQSWLMSVTEVEVDADLTDNVQTVIRLLNQRDWNVSTKAVTSVTALQYGRGGYIAQAGDTVVALDLAYVTLKDFIYSPLTLTIGRQDLWFGKGLIVGLNQQNPRNELAAPEYTAINSFDALKAVLDFDPWTITGVYSKIFGNAIQDNDDVNLWGVNVGYKFDAYKAEAEGYWFFKQDNEVDTWGAIKSNNDVHTIGLRGSLDPIDVITLFGEAAYQGGEYVGSRLQINNRDRSAWAIDVGADWRYMADKFAWKPKIGAEYVYYSGSKPEDNGAVSAGAWNGWDPMYRGKFDSAIREFVGRYYTTARYPQDATLNMNPDAAYQNQHQAIISGSIQPIESLLLKLNYNLFWNQEKYYLTQDKSQGFIGQEVDLQATWDYTEDVSFNVLCGWFMPGEVYYDNRNDVATDLVGSVKVSF